MSSKRNNFKKVHFLAAFVFVLGIVFTPLARDYASAADLVNRRITLTSSFASENVNHIFDFTTVTASNIGSVQFQYCSNSPLFIDPCVAPVGLNVAGAGIFSQTGITGFSVSGASTASNLIITRAPIATAPTSASYRFSNIINPSTADSVVFVRITVFDNINATGSVVDQGAVVFVVDDRYNIDAYVPPYLTFCVAVSVALDCTTTSGFLAEFGEFSEFTPTTVTSQMAAATNDPDGYNIFINGTTMTSGNNIIPPLLVQAPSQPGTSQFGINLTANTNPSVGSSPSAGPVANGSPAPNYNVSNQFRFVNGERVAGANISSGFNRYTVSYIVNVNENQAPGLYATTMSYTAVASF